MNYELAKKLKEAGFPQIGTGEIMWYIGNERVRDDVAMQATAFVFPALSELIEAIVGDKPNSFYLEYNDNWAVYEETNPDGKWRARYYDITPVGFYECFADTPEDAVAALWLELNGSIKP